MKPPFRFWCKAKVLYTDLCIIIHSAYLSTVFFAAHRYILRISLARPHNQHFFLRLLIFSAKYSIIAKADVRIINILSVFIQGFGCQEVTMKFAIDAFGGDNAPSSVINGTLDAMLAHDDFSVIFTGDETRIREELAARETDFNRLSSRIEIVHAPDIITCDEQSTLAIKRKKESSLVKALRIVSDGEADCFISAGSSGAILAGATLIVKRIPGVLRPALAPLLPTLKGPVMLIDCGANADCKPEYLSQFAEMGTAYMKRVVGIENPRIGLINNGAEEGKGNELTKAAYSLLKENPNIIFTGNCEAREIMSGDYDVVVCDGFVGNAILKAMEGTIAALLSMLKTELMSSTITKVGAAMSKSAFRTLKAKMDYREYGGAPLLGIRSGIIKAHGSSNARAIYSAVEQARKLINGNVTGQIAEFVVNTPKTTE